MLAKTTLYQQGIDKAVAFLQLNSLPIPTFLTYDEANRLSQRNDFAFKVWRKTLHGPSQGTGTGLYSRLHVFVSLQRAANMIDNPRVRNWSYPGYKIDRTPTGVVAHEVGHLADEYLRYPSQSTDWKFLWKKGKRITGYEPVSSEGWAETLRLFILNPDLLRLGSNPRYQFVSKHLKPSETRDFRTVLNGHPAYIAAAENWIARDK